jgi:hypothetical protein
MCCKNRLIKNLFEIDKQYICQYSKINTVLLSLLFTCIKYLSIISPDGMENYIKRSIIDSNVECTIRLEITIQNIFCILI